jgi:proton glutamate symport protein
MAFSFSIDCFFTLANRLKLLFLIYAILVAALHVLHGYHFFYINSIVFLCSRVIIYVALLSYCLQKKKLTSWIFLSMILGCEVGYTLPEFGIQLKILGKIFLKLIKTIIAPLLIATLSLGIANQNNKKQLGRLAWKSILYFEIITTLALAIGIIAINISGAGHGINLQNAASETIEKPPAQNWEQIILHIFPENIAKSIAEGQILQIVVFSLLFGTALSMLCSEKKAPLLKALDSLAEAMFRYTHLIMYMAPIAVFGAIAYTVSHMGLGILYNLFNLLCTLYLALAALIIFVFLPIAWWVKLPIGKFVKAISEPTSIAFATTTSEAALPKAMLALESLGVSRKVISFVMPMGYSFNLDGTSLYLSLASVFVAQAANISLTWQHQASMVFTLMLTSKGVAGVPRASLVILIGTASSFGLPIEPIFIILGIDELMDMARSAINVVGNCLATYSIAYWEKEINSIEEKS